MTKKQIGEIKEVENKIDDFESIVEQTLEEVRKLEKRLKDLRQWCDHTEEGRSLLTDKGLCKLCYKKVKGA